MSAPSQENQETDHYGAGTPIRNLEQYGFSAGDCAKFAEAGFHTIESIAFTAKSM